MRQVRDNDYAYHTYDTYLQVYANTCPFLVWVQYVSISGGMVGCLLKNYLFFFSIYFLHIYNLSSFLSFGQMFHSFQEMV